MDKIRAMLQWIKAKRFWISSILLSLAMIGTWFWTTGKIREETKTFTSKVTGQISLAEGIMRVTAEEDVTAHPNSTTEAGMKSELDQSFDSLVKAWRERHRRQQRILKWPTEIIGNEEFVNAFSRFDPPETFPEKYTGLGLDRYLTLYRKTIPKQMIKLAEIIRTKWNYDPALIDQEELQRRGGMGRMDDEMFGGGLDRGRSRTQMETDELNRYAVIWDDLNQEMWYKKLTEFKQRDDHFMAIDDPTPLQVYMLQQDLWLLEAMFDIIREVNGDADANDLATIKRIDHVAFGREARTQLGKLTPFDPRLAGFQPSLGVSEFGEFGEEAMYSEGEFSEGQGVEGGFNKLASYKPYHGRYVDVNFEPLSAETVRSVLTATTLPEQHLELIVAKRVPVRIALRMDERKIPEFLAACANSQFAFEIHQVRMNRHLPSEGLEINGGGYGTDNSAAGGAGGMGGMGMGGMDDFGGMGMDDMGGDFGMDRGMGMGMGMGMGTKGDLVELKSTDVEIRTSYDVDVEFYGIVKIYNPVREKILLEAIGRGNDEVDPSSAAFQTPRDNTETSKL